MMKKMLTKLVKCYYNSVEEMYTTAIISGISPII